MIQKFAPGSPGQSPKVGPYGTHQWSGLDEHRSSLRSFLQGRCPDDNDIHDIIQDAFLRAARYRSAAVAPAHLRGWLIRIASNVQVDKARRRARDPQAGMSAEVWDTVGEPEPDREHLEWEGGQVPLEEALDCMRTARTELLPHDWDVLSQYYLQRSGTGEIARRMGITSDMVKVRLFRARRRLRELVEKQFRFQGGIPCALS